MSSFWNGQIQNLPTEIQREIIQHLTPDDLTTMMSSLLIKESPQLTMNKVVHQVQNYEIMVNQFSTATKLLKHLKLLARMNSVEKVSLNLVGVTTEFLSEYYNAVENICMYEMLLEAQEPMSQDSMSDDSENSYSTESSFEHDGTYQMSSYNNELYIFLRTKVHEIKHEEQYRWLAQIDKEASDVISLTRLFENIDQLFDRILSLYLFISIKILHQDYGVITKENAQKSLTAFKTLLDQAQNENFRDYLKEVFWASYFDDLINQGNSELLVVVQREG
jgi:hypothetical protein